MAWTDEEKQEIIQKYKDSDPTPENSMEIVKELAEESGQSPNGVRMILTQAGVYVKKTAAKASASSTTSDGKAPRVSKEAAHAALTAAIEAHGATADQEIISKMTGKAAQYFTAVLQGNNED